MSKVENVFIGAGYAGRPKVEARIGGNWYIIETSAIEVYLANKLNTEGYAITQSSRQKYPRINLNTL